MALKAQAPIVPVAIQGGRDAMRRGSRIILPVHVQHPRRRADRDTGMTMAIGTRSSRRCAKRIEALLARGAR
jgi:1-acyl-sn-glycerol-3-phosphate acyltransferase